MISELFNKYGSDKSSRHTYHLIYNWQFAMFDRNAPINILESGVETGASLMAWREYFPNASITGVDIVDQRKEEYKDPSIDFILSDIKQYKPDKPFDLIIEDGNHSNLDCLWAGVVMSKWLRKGGLMFIEDVQEGFQVPFLLWGQLHGDYIVSAIDMRRFTDTHDNFLIRIDYPNITKVIREKPKDE